MFMCFVFLKQTHFPEMPSESGFLCVAICTCWMHCVAFLCPVSLLFFFKIGVLANRVHGCLSVPFFSVGFLVLFHFRALLCSDSFISHVRLCVCVFFSGFPGACALCLSMHFLSVHSRSCPASWPRFRSQLGLVWPSICSSACGDVQTLADC